MEQDAGAGIYGRRLKTKSRKLADELARKETRMILVGLEPFYAIAK